MSATQGDCKRRRVTRASVMAAYLRSDLWRTRRHAFPGLCSLHCKTPASPWSSSQVNCVTGVVQYRGPIAVAAAALAARAPVSQALVSSAAATAASAAVAAEAAILAEDSISKARVLASPESVYLAGRQPAVSAPAASPSRGETTPE